jgi:RsiW-degrading membrane proteinase PrsW (M82 family)
MYIYIMLLPFFYLLIAFIPVLVYILLIWATAPWKSIDLRKAFTHFITGITSVGIILTLHRIFPSLVKPIGGFSFNTAYLIFAFIQVSLFEEISKFASFLIGEKVSGGSDTQFKEKAFATMFYSGISHLSFAFIENVSYALIYGTDVLLIRSVVSMLVHFLCGLIMGYWVAKGRMGTRIKMRSFSEILFNKRPDLKIKIYYVISLLTASFIHGLYDYNLFTGGNFVSSSLIILGAGIACYLAAKDLIESKQNQRIRNSKI